MGSGVLPLLAVILIHSHYGILRACKVTVSQPAVYKAVLSQGSVTLPCQIKGPGCSGDFDTYWFRYLASGHEELDTTERNSRFISNKSALNITLEIKGLQIEDSGVYVCGIAFKDAVATGIGTTLVVRERETSIVTPSCIALIFFCILLLAYSTSAFFVYGYRSKWKLQKCLANRRSHPTETEKRCTARQRMFRAIAQEYHKRYPRKKDNQNEVREDDTVYQNT